MIDTIEKWKEQYDCSFEPDPRWEGLIENLEQYFLDSEHLTNKEAMLLWRQFRQWCRYYGFTSKEINQAKQSVNHRR